MSNSIRLFYLLILFKSFECQVNVQRTSASALIVNDPIIQLGQYRVNNDLITLSGFSSGGTFAQQLYFSYSSLIHGIAVISHTHYRCGPVTTNQEVYDNACTRLGNNSQPYDYNNVFRDINEYLSRGLIEHPSNMRNKRLYIYAGTENWLFTPEMSFRIGDVFQPYIQNDRAIRTVLQNANHTFPTNRPEYPLCNASPNDIALSNCGYSGAYEALQFLLGPEVVRPPTPNLQLEPLLSFDQSKFFHGVVGRHDMDTIGYLYIPRKCKGNNGECLLHFYFHGCMVGREFVGQAHIQNSGFLEVAEMNGIIMVFPQALSSPENDIGCWDTYGFTGPLYATQKGGQVTVVRNMLSKILGEVPFANFNFDQNLRQYEPPTIGLLDQITTASDFVSRYLQPYSNVFRYLENLRNF